MHEQKSIWGLWFIGGLVKTLSITGAIAAVAVCALQEAARGASLTSWRFDPATNQLEINLNEGRTPRYFLLSQPSRIVVDLPQTQLGKVEKQKNYSGSVRQIRVAQLKPDVTRIVVELSPQVVLAPSQVQMLLPRASTGNKWLLRTLIPNKPTESVAAAPTTLGATLPPATLTTSQTTVVVQVPPPIRQVASTASEPAPAETLPTMLSAGRSAQILQTPTIRIPQWQTATADIGETSTNITVIDFGQPLPKTKPETLSMAAVENLGKISPDVLIPAGTLLKLRYPGENILSLEAGTPRQEVLLLQEEIRSSTGKILVPAGTPIVGRFETSSSGSRFITQAITLGGNNLPLVAQSDILGGKQQVSETQIAGNSALNSLQPATIQPGQILQVEMTQDWR